MKSFLIILPFILYAVTSNSQIVLLTRRNNFLYLGVKNRLILNVDNYNSKSLTLVASCGKLTKDEYGYNWELCDSVTNRVTFKCYHNKKILDSISFSAKKYPDPIIIVKPVDGHFTSHKDRPRSLAVLPIDQDYDIRFLIKEYTVVLVKNKTDTLYFKNTIQPFSVETITAIYNLNKGDLYKIINMVVFNKCEMKERKLADTEFYEIIE